MAHILIKKQPRPHWTLEDAWGLYPGDDYYDYSQPYATQTWYYCFGSRRLLLICNTMQHQLAGGPSQLTRSIRG